MEYSQQEILRIRAAQAMNAPANELVPPQREVIPPARAVSPPAAPGGLANAQPAGQANTAGLAPGTLPAANPLGAPQPAAAGPAAFPQPLHQVRDQAAFQMVAAQANIDRADAAKRELRTNTKKVTLPELDSGTKASSLNLHKCSYIPSPFHPPSLSCCKSPENRARHQYIAISPPRTGQAMHSVLIPCERGQYHSSPRHISPENGDGSPSPSGVEPGLAQGEPREQPQPSSHSRFLSCNGRGAHVVTLPLSAIPS